MVCSDAGKARSTKRYGQSAVTRALLEPTALIGPKTSGEHGTAIDPLSPAKRYAYLGTME